MNKRFLSILLLFINTLSYSQNDSLVKTIFDHNLTISFPEKPDSMRKLGSEIYYVKQNTRTFTVYRQDSISLNVRDERSFKISLRGMLTGYSRNLTNYKLYNDVSDSTVGGAFGKFIYSFKPDTAIKDMQVITFFTIQENKAYFIEISSIGYDPKFIEETKPILLSAKFFGKPYDLVEGSTSYKIGYIIGSVLFYALLIVGIVWLIRRLTRRRRRRSV